MIPMQQRRSLTLWSVVGLLLLAFALRVYALGVRELNFDEVASVFIAARGPLGLLDYLRGAIREHPPFYYLLLSLWMPLVGQSEFAVRFLSVIIGMVTVAATYLLVQRTVNQPVALLTAFLLALSPFHIRASQDARMYGLLALCSLLSIFIFIRLLPPWGGKREGQTRWWGLFWLATGLGMFTHYYMAFVLLAEDLFLLLNWRRYRHLWPRWLAAHVALGGVVALWAILSPGLWATLLSFWRRGAASQVRWEGLSCALNGLYLGATLRPNWSHLGLPLLLTALGIGLAQWRNLWLPQDHRHGGLLLGLLLGVPLLAVLALPERVTGRYLTVALPACVLAMALAISQIVKWAGSRVVKWPIIRCSLFIVTCSLLIGIIFVDVSAYHLIYFPPGDSLRARLEYLQARSHPDDGLLLHGPWQTLLLTYYDPGPLKRYTVPLNKLEVDAGPADEALSGIFSAHDRVWVSYSAVEPVDPDWIVSRWLHEHTHQVWSEGDLVLYYAAPAQGLPPELIEDSSKGNDLQTSVPSLQIFLPVVMRNAAGRYEHAERVGIRFGEGLRLVGVALDNLEPVSGEAILLLTQWRTLQDIPHGLILWLELVDLAGHVWGEYQFHTGPAHVPTQSWSAGETFVERRGLVVPIGTPPGDYTLRMHVLLPEGGEWSPESEGLFKVGPVHVDHSAPTRALQTLPGRELRATFGDVLALVGYEPGGLRFTQGNPLLFTLYWQALASPSEDYELGIELIGDDGTVTVEQRVQPVADWFPTGQWQAGDVLLGRYAVPLPLDAPPGRYQVRLTLYTPDGSALPVGGTRSYKVLDWWPREETLSGTGVTLFEVEIEARPRLYHPPAMDHRLDVVLGDDVRLLGYDLASTSVNPGGTIELTLYWQALQKIEAMYAVFNHMVGPDGTTVAQADGWPQGGTYPTIQWLPGEVVEDRYTILVPPDTPPGEYTLRVGMYDAGTDERPITLVDGESIPERYVVLTTVEVSRP